MDTLQGPAAHKRLCVRLTVLVVLLAVVASGCSTTEAATPAPVAPTPTATPVPIEFDRFFEPDAPAIAEPTWYEITEMPERWPSLVSLPRTLRTDDGSFVESIRDDGTRVLTGRFYYRGPEDYVGDLRQDLIAVGFVSEDYFENSVGATARLSHGSSRVEIMSALGYAIVDVIE